MAGGEPHATGLGMVGSSRWDGAARDRAAGILMGLVAGDRNGGPARLAKRLSESLALRRSFDADDVARRWHEWFLTGRSYDEGPITLAVLRALRTPIPFRGTAKAFEEAAREVDVRFGGETAGSGPLRRAAPIAAVPFLDAAAMEEAARGQARLTHRHPLAGESAAAVVLACRLLVEGRPWSEALAFASAGRPESVASALRKPGDRPPGRGGFAPEVLHAAAHFVERAGSFAEALETSLRFAGPDNLCAATAGALAGARWGASTIPPDSLEHEKGRKLAPRMAALAARLAPPE